MSDISRGVTKRTVIGVAVVALAFGAGRWSGGFWLSPEGRGDAAKRKRVERSPSVRSHVVRSGGVGGVAGVTEASYTGEPWDALSPEKREALYRLVRERLGDSPGKETEIELTFRLAEVMLGLTEAELQAVAEMPFDAEAGEEVEGGHFALRAFALLQLGRLNPERALESLLSLHQSGSAVADMVDELFGIWVRKDGAGAVAGLMRLVRATDGDLRHVPFRESAEFLLKSNPSAAADLVMQLSESPIPEIRKIGDDCGHDLVEELLDQGNEINDVFAWIETVGVDEAQRHTFFHQALVTLLGQKNADGALAAFAKMSASGALPDVDSIKEMGALLAPEHPENVGQVAVLLPEGESRAALVGKAVETLVAQENIPSALALLQSLGTHPDYDPAYAELANVYEKIGAGQAMACIDAMSPSETRERCRIRLSYAMVIDNTPGAAEVVTPEVIENCAKIKAVSEALSGLIPGHVPQVGFELQ